MISNNEVPVHSHRCGQFELISPHQWILPVADSTTHTTLHDNIDRTSNMTPALGNIAPSPTHLRLTNFMKVVPTPTHFGPSNLMKVVPTPTYPTIVYVYVWYMANKAPIKSIHLVAWLLCRLPPAVLHKLRNCGIESWKLKNTKINTDSLQINAFKTNVIRINTKYFSYDSRAALITISLVRIFRRYADSNII